MPEGLDIDHKKQLNGTMPPYAQHVVIRTGRADWSSRIEDEVATLGEGIGGGNLAKSLKALVGRGGKYHDPSHPILITNSSQLRHSTVDKTPIPPNNFQAIQLYPQNLLIPSIPNTPEGRRAFVQQHLMSNEKKGHMVAMKKHIKHSKIADPEHDATGFPTGIEKQQHLRYIPFISPSIFICGHNSRDIRCGILGPLLRQAFVDCINRETQRPGLQGMLGPRKVITEGGISYLRMKNLLQGTGISLISHIGGHAFAGNVVIYIPKKWKLRDRGKRSPLAGKGIWYGRVEPKHVWGIVEETIQNGRVIEELLRGVHSAEKGPRGVEKTSAESTGDEKKSNEET